MCCQLVGPHNERDILARRGQCCGHQPANRACSQDGMIHRNSLWVGGRSCKRAGRSENQMHHSPAPRWFVRSTSEMALWARVGFRRLPKLQEARLHDLLIALIVEEEAWF